MISDERLTCFYAWVYDDIGYEGVPRKQIIKGFEELLAERKQLVAIAKAANRWEQAGRGEDFDSPIMDALKAWRGEKDD